jgi:hypothetical protein
MIYIAGFALVFIGFCLGFIVAIACATAGRADELERKILDDINRR